MLRDESCMGFAPLGEESERKWFKGLKLARSGTGLGQVSTRSGGK